MSTNSSKDCCFRNATPTSPSCTSKWICTSLRWTLKITFLTPRKLKTSPCVCCWSCPHKCPSTSLACPSSLTTTRCTISTRTRLTMCPWLAARRTRFPRPQNCQPDSSKSRLAVANKPALTGFSSLRLCSFWQPVSPITTSCILSWWGRTQMIYGPLLEYRLRISLLCLSFSSGFYLWWSLGSPHLSTWTKLIGKFWDRKTCSVLRSLQPLLPSLF